MWSFTEEEAHLLVTYVCHILLCSCAGFARMPWIDGDTHVVLQEPIEQIQKGVLCSVTYSFLSPYVRLDG